MNTPLGVRTEDMMINALQDGEANSIAELELFIGRPIKLQAEPLYAQEQFDVVLI